MTDKKMAADTPAPVDRDIIGWIGPADDRYVSGWIVDRNDHDKRLSVIVEINGETLLPIIADVTRANLRKRGINNVKHGFKVYVPDAILSLDPGPIRMWAADTPDTVIEARDMLAEFTESDPLPLGDVIGETMVEVEKSNRADWNKIVGMGGSILKNTDLDRLLLTTGRACLRVRRNEDAKRLLGACVALFPRNMLAQFYQGVAQSNLNEHAEAIETFRKLRMSGWNPLQTLSEYSRALTRAIDTSGHKADALLEETLIDVCRELVKIDDGSVIYIPTVCLRLSHCGEVDLALQIADHLITRRPTQPQGLVNKARIMIEQGRYTEGLDLSREILDQWPDNEVAKYHMRVYSEFSETKKNPNNLTFALIQSFGSKPLACAVDGTTVSDDAAPLGDILAITSDTDFVVVSEKPVAPDTAAWQKLVTPATRAGCVDLPDGAGALWRVDALRNLVESKLLTLDDTLLQTLARWRPFYLDRAVVAPATGGQVLLISRYGATKFGGAEHTMASLAGYYRETGRTVILAGTDENVEQNIDIGPGTRGDRVPADPAELRAYILENGFDVIHAISGMGFQVAQALAFTNISMVYGIYYWRDVLGRDGMETFFDDEGAAMPRAEFKYIILQAQKIFVNSKYTRGVIEEAHNVRFPIIYSIPEEITQ